MINSNNEDMIIKGIGGFYYVSTKNGVIECKAKGIFRKRGITPLAGDNVKITDENGGWIIEEIFPRKNFFVRPPISNLDVMFILASTVEPSPNRLLLDKMTAIAVSKDVKPVIVVTKCDMASHKEICDNYALSNITVIAVSADNDDGVQQIKELVKGNITAFTGNSGVGKSTLLGRLMPEKTFETAEISKKLGRGKHTTRQVELFSAFGGLIADTSGFSLLDMERACLILKEDIQYTFPDIEPHIENCQFTGCSHRTEKGCAVIKAVEEKKITKSRYSSYVEMYNAALNIKEWQTKK